MLSNIQSQDPDCFRCKPYLTKALQLTTIKVTILTLYNHARSCGDQNKRIRNKQRKTRQDRTTRMASPSLRTHAQTFRTRGCAASR